MIDHDAMMLSIGLILMGSNLIGACFTVRRVKSRRQAAAEETLRFTTPIGLGETDNAVPQVVRLHGQSVIDHESVVTESDYTPMHRTAVITSDSVRLGKTLLALKTIRDVRFSPAERKLFELTLTTASVQIYVTSVNRSGILLLNREIRDAIARRGPSKEVVVELGSAEVDVQTRADGA